jgi:hypothetical protein
MQQLLSPVSTILLKTNAVDSCSYIVHIHKQENVETKQVHPNS